MANVVRDPKVHPEAILPDLSKPDPLVKFTKDDVAFVYGSIWKQRYFTKKGDDYFPLPAQWDVTHQVWRAYHAAPAPIGGPRSIPTTTCSAPPARSATVATRSTTTSRPRPSPSGTSAARSATARAACMSPTVSRRTSSTPRASISCGQRCLHPVPLARPAAQQSRSRANTTIGRSGFEVGRICRTSGSSKITSSASSPSPISRTARPTKIACRATTSSTSQMYTHGVTCFSCHDVHGTENNADLIKPANVLCLECHGPNSPNGPRAARPSKRTRTTKPAARQRVRRTATCRRSSRPLPTSTCAAHTFKFITPSTTDSPKVPNACQSCHASESPDFAANALKSWSNVSPWRMQNLSDRFSQSEIASTKNRRPCTHPPSRT